MGNLILVKVQIALQKGGFSAIFCNEVEVGHGTRLVAS